jgi:hypothetical protein
MDGRNALTTHRVRRLGLVEISLADLGEYRRNIRLIGGGGCRGNKSDAPAISKNGRRPRNVFNRSFVRSLW